MFGLGAPLVAHGLCLFLLLLEAEETWLVFIVTMFPAFGIGMLSEYGRRPVWEAAVAAAWIPAWLTWSKWYWAIGMPSAGGAGGKVAELMTGRQDASTAGVFGAMAFCGAAGWMLARLDRRHKRLYGTSMFGEE